MKTDETRKEVTAPEWGQHLVVVFTVLIGVSFAQAFSVLGQTLTLSKALLIVTVFYVVFDCWYAFTVNIKYIQATGGVAISFTLLTLLSYSCLPFLYLAHNATTAFGPPEFLAANLAAICILDAVQRYRVFGSNGGNATPEDQEWHIKNTYLIGSGAAYFVFLAALIIIFVSAAPTVDLRAAIVLILWLVFRLVDHYVIGNVLPKQGSWLFYKPSSG